MRKMVILLFVTALCSGTGFGNPNAGSSFPSRLAEAGGANTAPSQTDAPDGCWKESGNPNLIDGLFFVTIVASGLSGSELTSVLADFYNDIGSSGTDFNSPGFPLAIASINLISFDLAGTPRAGESRAAFISRISNRIQYFQTLPGVTISCEHKGGPVGAVSGGT